MQARCCIQVFPSRPNMGDPIKKQNHLLFQKTNTEDDLKSNPAQFELSKDFKNEELHYTLNHEVRAILWLVSLSLLQVGGAAKSFKVKLCKHFCFQYLSKVAGMSWCSKEDY